MRSWLLLPLVAAGCYHPVDVAHCAITCDPLVGNCPGELICGTDSFCHALDEPLNGCVAGLFDAPPQPDAQIFPHDGPPDSPVLAIDAPACSSEWHADFSSDPTTGSGLAWTSVGTVAFDFAAQVSAGTWNAPDMTGLATSPSTDFQTQTTINAVIDLPQVGESAALVIGLTDGTQLAQLTFAIGHPTAGTDSVALTNNFGGAQPEMLASQSAPIGNHHIRLDVQWPTSTVTFTIDAAAATQATFTKGVGTGIPASVAIRVTSGANVDDIDVCVPVL